MYFCPRGPIGQSNHFPWQKYNSKIKFSRQSSHYFVNFVWRKYRILEVWWPSGLQLLAGCPLGLLTFSLLGRVIHQCGSHADNQKLLIHGKAYMSDSALQCNWSSIERLIFKIFSDASQDAPSQVPQLTLSGEKRWKHKVFLHCLFGTAPTH